MKEWVSPNSGITRRIIDNGDGTMDVLASQDLTDRLDLNKACYTHNDGYSPSRDIRRAAFIPDILAYKWLVEEGWWYADPNAREQLFRKLNDPDYLYLRTAPGHIAENRQI